MRIERGLQKEGLAPRGSLHLFNEAARHNLDQDLGNEEGSNYSYDIDQETRDRLIAHARQDASLAAMLANEALKESRYTKAHVRIAIVLLAILIWRLW